jgi:hypothetical protein
MKILIIVFFLAGLNSVTAKTSYIPPTQLLKKGGYQLGLGVDGFSSKKLTDKSGSTVDWNPNFSNYSFSRYQADFYGHYGATNDLQFGLGARLRSNQATLFDSLNGEYTASSMGLQSTFVSAQYAFKMVGQLQYTLETIFRYTPYSNQEVEVGDPLEDLILGDDGNELSAGLGVTYFSKKNNFYTFKGAYKKAGRDISDEVLLNAEAALAWSNVALIAGIEGIVSVQNDPYNLSETRPVFNAGSNMYKTRNREWAMPYVGLNFALGNKWRLELRGGQVVYSKSYNSGTSYGLQLVRRVESESVRFTDTRFKTYDIEGSIVKISEQKGYVVVDRGLTEGIQKGMKFDFFEFDYVGGNILIASGVVVEVKTETCIVKITQKYQANKDIKEGLVGRSLLK